MKEKIVHIKHHGKSPLASNTKYPSFHPNWSTLWIDDTTAIAIVKDKFPITRQPKWLASDTEIKLYKKYERLNKI